MPTFDTVYQNTTGHPIFVQVILTPYAYASPRTYAQAISDASSTPTTVVSEIQLNWYDNSPPYRTTTLKFIVLNNHYYKITAVNHDPAIREVLQWTEHVLPSTMTRADVTASRELSAPGRGLYHNTSGGTRIVLATLYTNTQADGSVGLLADGTDQTSVIKCGGSPYEREIVLFPVADGEYYSIPAAGGNSIVSWFEFDWQSVQAARSASLVSRGAPGVGVSYTPSATLYSMYIVSVTHFGDAFFYGSQSDITGGYSVGDPHEVGSITSSNGTTYVDVTTALLSPNASYSWWVSGGGAVIERWREWVFTYYSPVVITTDPDTFPEGCGGIFYSQTLTAEGSLAPYTWSSVDLPVGLSLDPDTGELSGTLDDGTYEFTVTVTSANSSTDSLVLTLLIHQTPVINGDATPSIFEYIATNISYSATAESDVSWSLVSGTLPAGLSLVDNEITGASTEFGVYDLVLSAVDVFGCEAQFAITLTVLEAPLITVTPLEACGNTPFSHILEANDGETPYVWTSNDLPVGVTLVADTGELRGTLSAGIYEFTVTVTDATNAPNSALFTLQVYAVPVIHGTAAATIDINTEITYSYIVIANSSVTLTIQDGALPPGMALVARTITGIPTVSGIYTFNLTATDAHGCIGQLAIVFRVQRQISITTQFIEGCVGHTVSARLSSSNGVGPFIWQVVAGELPEGVALDQVTGIFSGIPTIEGIYQVAVKVTDLNSAATAKTTIGFLVYDQGCAGKSVILPRIISLASSPMRVVDRLHQETMFDKLPTPLFNTDRESPK